MARRKTRGAQEQVYLGPSNDTLSVTHHLQVLKAAMKAVLECDPSGATIYRIAQDREFLHDDHPPWTVLTSQSSSPKGR